MPAVDGDAVARLLVASEMERGRARRCSAIARRGLEQLRQALSRYPECPEAAWAVDPDVVCRRLSLLGEFTAEDSEVMAGFAGLRHAELMDRAGHLITDPDLPLLGRLDDRWYVQEPENAFLLLRKSFTPQDLTDFAELALRAEDFPRLRRTLQDVTDTYENEGVRQESQAEGYRRDIW